MLRTAAFRCMGTDISVIAPDVDGFRAAVERVRARFDEEDRRFSRFRPDSELTQVNRSSGDRSEITPSFADVVDRALVAAAATDGLFDPTVHDAMLAAGYDRDFDEVLAGARGALHPAEPCGRWREIERHADAISLPAGVHLDLGGIAKGWTVDRAAEAVLDLLPWVVVNAGGDLRLAGAAEPIEVAIEDPEHRDEELMRTTLRAGAIATSSVCTRAWGEDLHHVIDPATGRPAGTELLQATVWARTCVDAEVAATHALLLGSSAGRRYPSVLVARCGEIVVSLPREPEVAA